MEMKHKSQPRIWRSVLQMCRHAPKRALRVITRAQRGGCVLVLVPVCGSFASKSTTTNKPIHLHRSSFQHNQNGNQWPRGGFASKNLRNSVAFLNRVVVCCRLSLSAHSSTKCSQSLLILMLSQKRVDSMTLLLRHERHASRMTNTRSTICADV